MTLLCAATAAQDGNQPRRDLCRSGDREPAEPLLQHAQIRGPPKAFRRRPGDRDNLRAEGDGRKDWMACFAGTGGRGRCGDGAGEVSSWLGAGAFSSWLGAGGRHRDRGPSAARSPLWPGIDTAPAAASSPTPIRPRRASNRDRQPAAPGCSGCGRCRRGGRPDEHGDGDSSHRPTRSWSRASGESGRSAGQPPRGAWSRKVHIQCGQRSCTECTHVSPMGLRFRTHACRLDAPARPGEKVRWNQSAHGAMGAGNSRRPAAETR